MGLFDLFAGNKQYLIDWQNVLCEDKSNRLYMTKQQLITVTVQQVQSTIKAFDDCSRLINTTVNPDVFFMRLAMAEDRLAKMVAMEPYFREVKQLRVNQSPGFLMSEFQNNKDRYVCDFLYRYYWDTKSKAEALKTDKARQGRYEKFRSSLLPYWDKISEQNWKYVAAMCNQKI